MQSSPDFSELRGSTSVSEPTIDTTTKRKDKTNNGSNSSYLTQTKINSSSYNKTNQSTGTLSVSFNVPPSPSNDEVKVSTFKAPVPPYETFKESFEQLLVSFFLSS